MSRMSLLIRVCAVKTGQLQRNAHCHYLSRAAAGNPVSAHRGQNPSRHQSRQRSTLRDWQSQAGRLWRRRPADKHQITTQHICGHAVLDGTRGHPARWLQLQGGHLVTGYHRHGDGERRATVMSHPPDESLVPYPKECATKTGGRLQQRLQRLCGSVPDQRL